MGYVIEINSLLKLSPGLRTTDIKEGDNLTIEKDAERLYPLHKPIDFCDSNYKYLGKLKINTLTLKKDKTVLEVTILKIFTPLEQETFSNAYIKD